MRRLRVVDWLLIGTLLPIWLFAVVTSAGYGVVHGYDDLPFTATSAASPDAYPVIRSLQRDRNSDTLAVGDRVVSINGIAMRGLTTARCLMHIGDLARHGDELQLTVERDGTQSAARLLLTPGLDWWLGLPFIVGLVGIALFILVRATQWHLARRFFLASLLIGIGACTSFNNPLGSPPLFIATAVLIWPLGFGVTAWNAFDFAPGVPPLRSWQRVIPWLPALLASSATAAAFFLPDAGAAALLMRSFPLACILFVGALLVAFTRAYRLTDGLGRRQIKWMVYGFYVGSLPYAVFQAIPFQVQPWKDIALTVALCASVAVPIGFLVAIAFYHWLDIDRLISATFSYSVLTTGGVAILLAVVPTVARAASDSLGLEPGSTQIFLSVAIAAMLVPADRFLRPRVDRLLFADRVARELGLESVLAEVAGCQETQALTRLLVDRLDALLRPTSVALYARVDDLFMPLDVRGRAVPPSLPAAGALIAALQDRTTPVAAARWTARHGAVLSPFERAALETLDVAVLLPIRRGAELAAFSCLGPKRSGDIYTPAELALLAALATATSGRMLSIDAAAIAEQARVTQEALRRYVPGAIAQRIVAGQDVEAGERELSVLFVDIRGYTGFSEPRAAEEIFGTVNQYTAAVSHEVQACGGTVVEFHGDGMMAVFGAPEAIAHKERAAVDAARAIVAAVAGLLPDGGESGLRLSVGVGIATGTTFVGNIRAVDRLIWTVIGNTPNLAARLQTLTRDLEAAVAIDATTQARAGDACAGFVCHANVAIRGRSQPEDVYALPLDLLATS